MAYYRYMNSDTKKCRKVAGTYICELPAGHGGEHQAPVKTRWNETPGRRKVLRWGSPAGERWVMIRAGR